MTTPKASAYHAHESEASAIAIQIEAKEGSITQHGSSETSAVGRFFRRLLPALSSAFVASVAYVDPGNFATNIQSGSNYGFTLLWASSSPTSWRCSSRRSRPSSGSRPARTSP
ncbi:hypothetical protein SPRG_16566, partial [Saprolegnia parasitica CBS 223.65]